MTAVRDTALAAAETLLRGLGSEVERNPAWTLPAKVPDSGLIVMHDGVAGEPEITLSPLTYTYRHEVVVQVFGRDAVRTALLTALGLAILTNRALGGAVDWLDSSGVVVLPAAPGSGAGQIAASLSLYLTYDSPTTV